MSEEISGEAAPSYEAATARLDEIIQRLDSGDTQLRETLELCGEAKALIEFCATELAAVDQGLKELKLEDLAASLTGATSPDPVTTDDPATAAEPSSPPERDVPF
ncbi:MAG TPA: exodeoxyribonuclease VII small subunit [Solirubrobacterales bacterium]|nr:exodeoxyribonuclease VII small subunit [Solirubrobacterales bacterium]